jgi:hypothetical protein
VEFVGEHLGEWPGPLVEEDSGQVSRCSCFEGVGAGHVQHIYALAAKRVAACMRLACAHSYFV